jgi:hypothetical protein
VVEREAVNPGCDRLSKRIAVIKFCAVPVSLQFWGRQSVLRDERGNGGRRPVPARNVLGEPLEICSFKPMTGFYRDGCCNTGQEDVGSHTVCAIMTAEFLAYSKSRGNDLSTPVQEFGFPGCNQATVGVYVPHVGGRLSKPVRRHALFCAPRTRVR